MVVMLASGALLVTMASAFGQSEGLSGAQTPATMGTEASPPLPTLAGRQPPSELFESYLNCSERC